MDQRDQVRSRLNVEPDGEVVLGCSIRTGPFGSKWGRSRGARAGCWPTKRPSPVVHLVARRMIEPEKGFKHQPCLKLRFSLA